jgi:hypothetical protein
LILLSILPRCSYKVGSGAVLYWLFLRTKPVSVVKGNKQLRAATIAAAPTPGMPPATFFEDQMTGPRNMILLGVYVAVMAVPASADTLPASVRACIGEADATRRLTCYDREVARAIAPPDTFSATAAVAPAAVAPAAAVAPSPPLSAVAAPAAQPRHLTAKVSAVRQSGDHLVVTLDNGNVWEQSAPATSQLNLRSGDTVQLDREMASWFLSDRYGGNIQVRLRPPP